MIHWAISAQVSCNSEKVNFTATKRFCSTRMNDKWNLEWIPTANFVLLILNWPTAVMVIWLALENIFIYNKRGKAT